jgi:uncharacterized cofD-like protein
MKENLSKTGLNVVAIGGGTGLARLLSGLKKHVTGSHRNGTEPFIKELTAVVTVTDDGGSSGRLREELRVLPPGDIRNCLVALSEDEPLMSELFQYRFPGRGHLRGHSFGNLFLTAMAGITGDFVQAIKVCSEVLAIKGRIYPSTIQDVKLIGELEGGKKIYGESAISKSQTAIKRLHLSPRNCHPVRGTLQAIEAADIITVGPGSLYTSLLPNLLIKRTINEIHQSQALKIYICNIMTQPGETVGFTASEHVKAIYKHTGVPIFDCIIINIAPVSMRLRKNYLKEGATQVVNDVDELKKLGLKIFATNLILEGTVVRHHPDKLAEAIARVYQRRDRRLRRMKDEG